MLYISDNGARRRVLIAAERGPTGKLGRSNVIHDFGSGRGIDGLTVTTDGRIVAAAGSKDKRASWSSHPTARFLATIPPPEDPANVEFGGEDGKTLHLRRQEPVPIKDDHDGVSALATGGPVGGAEPRLSRRGPPVKPRRSWLRREARRSAHPYGFLPATFPRYQ